jgi:nitroreductase
MKPDIYEYIFKRKSIRNYNQNPLDKNTLKKISAYMEELKPLYNDISIDLKIISPTEINARFQKKAPHYIAIFSEKKEGYLTNVGFMMQQMDLFLSSQGIGCCWQGIPKPKTDVKKSSSLEFIILMAFGNPDEAIYREISEFKRKSLDKISDIDCNPEKRILKLLESARLAPSATNSQPWFFSCDSNIIHLYCTKSNFIKSIIMKKWNQIDMGICLYHLCLASQHKGYEVKIEVDKSRGEEIKGYNYVTSIHLN